MTQPEYEKKERECWEEFCKSNPAYDLPYCRRIYEIAFDRAYDLGKKTGNTDFSDVEEEEMLTVKASTVREMYAANDRLIDDHISDEIERQAAIINEMLRSLFGSKCLPDEVGNEDNFATKEPNPAEPKFKVGDKVIFPRNADEDLNGTIVHELPLEPAYIVVTEDGKGYTVFEHDLESYTELTRNEAKENEEACASDHIPDATKMTDDDFCNKLIQRGFKNHNRLHIASTILSGLIAAPVIPGVNPNPSVEDNIRLALRYADALLSECEKGGSL